MGPVADLLQRISHTLTGCLLQYRFIRVFPRPKIVEVHAHNGLELCVGGPGSHHGHLKVTGGILLHIPVKIWDRILRQPDTVQKRRIKKRLQLYKDDVGPFAALFLRQRLLCIPLHNLSDGFLRIIVGLAHAGVKQTGGKTIRKSVILIGVSHIAEKSRHHPFFNGCMRHYGEAPYHQRRHHQLPAKPLLLIQPGHSPKQHHQCCRRQYQHQDHQHHLKSRQIMAGHLQCILKKLQIRPCQRRYPVGQDHPVGNAACQPDKRDQDGRKSLPLHQIDEQITNTDEQRIVQEDQRPSCQIFPRFHGRMPGGSLNDKIDDRRQADIPDPFRVLPHILLCPCLRIPFFHVPIRLPVHFHHFGCLMSSYL